MKRIFSFIVTTLLCLMIFSTFTANAEETSASTPYERFEDGVIYVLRPNVKFVHENGEFERLHFGEVVEVTDQQDTYAFIKTLDGKTGKVTVGFLGITHYPMLWLDKEGCFLAPVPGLEPKDFTYGACGQRWEEKAIVLLEDGDFFFIVTEEGFSGYLRKDDPHLQLYTGQVPEK